MLGPTTDALVILMNQIAIHKPCLCVFSSAYEPKRAAGPNKSSCPQGTPMSPMQHHYSPKPAGGAGGRPDNTAYNMNSPAASQPLPNHNNYPMNPRY